MIERVGEISCSIKYNRVRAKTCGMTTIHGTTLWHCYVKPPKQNQYVEQVLFEWIFNDGLGESKGPRTQKANGGLGSDKATTQEELKIILPNE